ncbi:phosphate/phosphite/phosphonate ABC transporter substrate-binding protein [Magnetofaba australis]|nr:phosphate/phosphite/phosphonate ABC transporter substrate-binding protein [Magnetofaba australis]
MKPLFWLIAFILFAPASAWSAAQPQPLALQIHPFLPSLEIHRRFHPLSNFLSQTLNRPVRIRIATNYAEHIQSFGEGSAQLAYMGPAPYVKLTEQFGAFPILGQILVNDSPTFTGVIAVRANSALGALRDLRGARVAFGDVNSTMSHWLPRYLMTQEGLKRSDLADLAHVGNHMNVAFGLLAGEFDAGALKQSIFKQFQSRGLRALATTPAIPNHVFVAAQNLPEEDVSAIRAALQALDAPDKRFILQALKPSISGTHPAVDADFDELRHVLRTTAAAPW